jgi:hypothetical protein
VIPGASHAGKTTLVAELVRQGAGYCSDEYLLLDEAGRAHPYPRPLAVRHAPGVFERRTAAELGGTQATGPLPVGVVLAVQYDPQVEGLEVQAVSPGSAALDLLAQCASGQARPQASLDAISLALASAVALRGRRGDAAGVAQRVLELAAGGPRTAEITT